MNSIRLSADCYTAVALVCVVASLHGQVPTTAPPSAPLPAIPPSVYSVKPAGLHRGSMAVITIEGRSLTGARAILFDGPGLTAKVTGITELPDPPQVIRIGVDLGAQVVRGTKQEARIEVTAGPDVAPGVHQFRVLTPMGTSNTVSLEVGTLPEIQETEPNNSLADSQRVELPATLVGSINMPGDVDSFQFEARAGQELVFQPVAASLGSTLQSVLVLRDSNGEELARAGEHTRNADSVLTYKLASDGQYSIAISDMEHRGGGGYFYRLNAGALPYISGVFPLGVRAGQTAEVAVQGANLGGVHRLKIQAPAHAEGWTTIPAQVKTGVGDSINRLELAVGDEPEVVQKEANDTPGAAQAITVPVAINGHVSAANPPSDVPGGNYFRFSAKKGQHLNIEVAAARLGSPLDSVIEVLDAAGHEIPRAIARSLVETTITLADKDSKSPNLRLTSSTDVHVNDYLIMGDELVQLTYVPDQPDDDLMMKQFAGERFSLFNTSPEAHPVTSFVYKAQILPPDAEFPPNGLPVLRLTWRNDDGGPGYGRDSRLDFIAPRDGDYLLHIQDARGLGGEKFAYRMTLRDAQPDFVLHASPGNPNVPRGGRVPVYVEANRMLGYEGPIAIDVKGLPTGVTASPAMIAAGQDSTVVILTAAADAPAQGGAPPAFQITGRGDDHRRALVRTANSGEALQVVALMPPPDLVVTAEPKEIVMTAGKIMPITIHCDRRNGFKGRVPYAISNLPAGVVVADIGFTGGFVNADETSRTINLRAADWVQSIDQPIYIVGTVESNSSTQHASAPLMLKIAGKQQAASVALSSSSSIVLHP